MSKETDPENINNRIKALPYLKYVFEQNWILRGQIASELLQQELGISEDDALTLVVDYADSLRRNQFSGGIVQLPEPKTDHSEPMTELEGNIGWFTLGYINQRIGLKSDNPLESLGLIEEGRYWFNNKEKDTRRLAEWMNINPDKVAAYMVWALGEPGPNQVNIVGKFQNMVREGKLKEIKFK